MFELRGGLFPDYVGGVLHFIASAYEVRHQENERREAYASITIVLPSI